MPEHVSQGGEDEWGEGVRAGWVGSRHRRLPGGTMEQTLEHTETDELVTDDDIAEEELLVEEISIDGMCGVY